MVTSSSTYIWSCNNPNCQTKITSGNVWLTFCSHIFCGPCGSKVSASMTCISCTSDVSGQFKLHKKNLEPAIGWKKMVLAGLPPDMIMEICSSAIQFYYHQTSHQASFLNARNLRLTSRLNSVREYYDSVIEHLSVQIKTLEARLSDQDGFTTRSGNNFKQTVDSVDVDSGDCQWSVASSNNMMYNDTVEKVDCAGGFSNSTFRSCSDPQFLLRNIPSVESAEKMNVPKSKIYYSPNPPSPLLKSGLFDEQTSSRSRGSYPYMNDNSMCDGIEYNNSVLKVHKKSAQSSYNQLPLLLGKITGQRKSSTYDGSSEDNGGSESCRKIMPYRRRRY